MQVPDLLGKPTPITQRSLAQLDADKAAVNAIAQAAINVELFTIPLYMSTMYSIQGMHQINSEKNIAYLGREWPGMSTNFRADTPNAKAFNIIFSVFIQEMLHLQMASNIATALGVAPSFTSLALQTATHGWHCYAADCSTVPHIVDLKDTGEYHDVRVNLEALNENQVRLFMAIEQPESEARNELAHSSSKAYFPSVPFAHWTPAKTELDLPMFGTIGWMYECYAQYLGIEYTDGECLFQKMFKCDAIQQDMFNVENSKGHPKKEFPHFDTLLTGTGDIDAMTAFDKVIDMMSAISDQDEGNAMSMQRYRKRQRQRLERIPHKYQEDTDALKQDYASFDQHGKQAPSHDAAARDHRKDKDHYERFHEVGALLPDVTTWKQWHADRDKAGQGWRSADLCNEQYDPAKAPANIPKPGEVADALNRLKDKGEETHRVLSKVAVGAIAGITMVLDQYWKQQDMTFPYPSMVGSGDRMSICWAVLGKSVRLCDGMGQPGAALQHACQGLSLAQPDPMASCAALEIYHTCKGSNHCHAQGGCGFAHADQGGGSCGAANAGAGGATGSGPLAYSAPSDNKCAGFGGCAVPISASQVYPDTKPPGFMKLYDFGGAGHTAQPLGQTMAFACGDGVYDKAWEAYKVVMASRGQPVTAPKPAPTDLRLALPPST